MQRNRPSLVALASQLAGKPLANVGQLVLGQSTDLPVALVGRLYTQLDQQLDSQQAATNLADTQAETFCRQAFGMFQASR